MKKKKKTIKEEGKHHCYLRINLAEQSPWRLLTTTAVDHHHSKTAL